MNARITLVLLAIATLAIAACAPIGERSLEDRVPDVQGEILYNSVFGDLPSPEISVFGVSLLDTQEDVVALHGDPDIEADYRFGTIVNMEYVFAGNQTSVIYNTELGVVKGILITQTGSQLLENPEQFMFNSTQQIYSVLGTPTRIVNLNRQRQLIYAEQGYEVFTRRGAVDRVFLTTPFSVQGPGVDSPVNESCAQVITPAVSIDTGECLEFPNPCLVPDDWEPVDSCEQ